MLRALLLLLLTSTAAHAQRASGQCKGLEGKTFRSVRLLVGGMLPEGEGKAHWTLRFGKNTFEWLHTDIIESGTFACTGPTVLGQAHGRNLKGSYNAKKKRLVWEGEEYELMPEPKKAAP